MQWCCGYAPYPNPDPVGYVRTVYVYSIYVEGLYQWCGSGSGSVGSISQRYGSGSESFDQQAKIVRKTLIPTALWLLFDFLSCKNYVNVPSKSNHQKNFLTKISFLLASWRSMTKIAGSGSASGSGFESGSISQRHGSAYPDPDPDPHQNVMDPLHCQAFSPVVLIGSPAPSPASEWFGGGHTR